jgi:hypothetical protein
MKHDPSRNLNSRGEQNNQVLHSIDAGLWNDPFTRRAFLKKSGMAGVATVVVMNGLKLDVVAGATGTPTCGV